MTKSLVQQAEKLKMKIGRRNKYTEPEHQKLALAWLDDKVTFTQVSKVLKMNGSSAYGFLCSALKAARQSKLI